MKGRLNLFQAAMLRWRDLHPYTAIHVGRIDRPLDAARLKALIARQLDALGLTGFMLDVARRRFEYTGGPAEVALVVHAGGSRPGDVLAMTIERELNLPFRARWQAESIPVLLHRQRAVVPPRPRLRPRDRRR